jgi:hypothetical protein
MIGKVNPQSAIRVGHVRVQNVGDRFDENVTRS